MVKKSYEWPDAELAEHSKRKHKILREYFSRYLAVRCTYPGQTKFRLAVVEGFAGGGRYKCGSPGSPLIFIEELRKAVESFNVRRAAEGMAPLDIECLLILNDADRSAIKFLAENVAPLEAAIKEEVPKLHLRVEYKNSPFEQIYPEIKALIAAGRFPSVLFNLDQCGHSLVKRETLIDIMRSYKSAEVFYTFGVKSLIAFTKKNDPAGLKRQLRALGLEAASLGKLEAHMSRSDWLATAEHLVFNAFQECAPYVSPFSINNPDGWRYWLIHFANSYKARQVYNNVLHDNASTQAHFGRAGLHMLTYDSKHQEGALYLFDTSGRELAKQQLVEDIPRLISEFGDALSVGEFYRQIYNATPAHAADIHSALIDGDDLQIITEAGGERRVANTISVDDTIRMKRQRSFFPIFAINDKSKNKNTK